MQRIVNKRGRKGFTLIELMVAIVILTIATLGLLQALTHYIRINMDNEMRNEAMRITEKRMELIRGLQFADTPQDELIPDDGVTVYETSAGAQFPITETKLIRKSSISYTVQSIISRLSFRSDGVTPNSKAIRVRVTWTNKGTSHQHSAATVITREW